MDKISQVHTLLNILCAHCDARNCALCKLSQFDEALYRVFAENKTPEQAAEENRRAENKYLETINEKYDIRNRMIFNLEGIK